MEGLMGLPSSEIQKANIESMSARELAAEPLGFYDAPLVSDLLVRILTELADLQDRLDGPAT